MNFRLPRHAQQIPSSLQFDPKKHLQLEKPEKIYTLKDFGYSEQQVAEAHLPIAVTTPFRLMSDEGVDCLKQEIDALSVYRRESDRMANFIRGSLYYSQFIRDFCLNQQVNKFISELAGGEILPHPMGLYQGHINLKPKEEGREVDRWHTDTVMLDYVLLVTKPQSFEGGHFEYFQCTKAQALRALIRDEVGPKIIKVEFPAAGYAVLQQGNHVVHRASAVTKGNERMTFVQSFIQDSPNFRDVSKLDDCKTVDPHDILFTEWARYKAFLSKRRLERLIEEIEYTDDTSKICLELRRAIRDVEEAVLEISDPSTGRLTHFGSDALTDLL
jgi:hypothetical protein